MEKLKDLEEMLCRELEEYAAHDSLDMGSLEIVDKLAHAIKNIQKIEESEYSEARGGRGGRSYGRSYDGGSYGGYGNRSYDGGSYEDGYMAYRGRRRDSMGRYTSADGMTDELRELAKNAPDDKTRRELMKLAERMG